MKENVLMKKIVNWCFENKISFISYGIAFLILLATYVIMGISPFGDGNILKIDMYHAYAPEMVQFQKVLSGESSWFHTWTGALGSNSFALLIFHVLSPFSLVTVLFPKEYITEASTLMFLLKIPFSAFTMSFLLRHKFKKSDYTVVIFSAMFAFCGFVMAYFWSYPWIDVIFALPLVMLGIDRLVKEEKKLLYCLSLAYAIYAYFYMAFFLCIFAVIYFAAMCILEETYKDKKLLLKRIRSFAVFSLLAGFVTAIINIPVIMTLLQTPYLGGAKNQYSGFYNIIYYLNSHFFGVEPALIQASAISGPNSYIGLLTVILLPLYYLNKKISLKEKIVYTSMLAVFFLLMEVKFLNFAAHLFHEPSGLPYRMSFVYSFLLLIMAYKAFINLEASDMKKIWIIIAGYSVLCLLLYAVNGHSPDMEDLEDICQSFTKTMCLINIGCIFVYSVYLLILQKINPKYIKNAGIILAVLVSAELIASNYISISADLDMNTSADDYIRTRVEDIESFTKKFDTETEFYRSTLHRANAISEAKMYGMRDITQFIAPTSSSVLDLTYALGVTSSMNSILFIDPTPLVSSILNVKYTMAVNYEVGGAFLPVTEKIGKVAMYENPYVLNLGFMVKDSIKDWDIAASESTYDIQNDFVQKATGKDISLFKEYFSEGCSGENTVVEKTGENTYSYTLNDPKDTSRIPTVTISFTAQESQRLYLRYTASACKNIKVLVNGVHSREFTSSQYIGNGVDVGFVEAGSKVDVVFTHFLKASSRKREYYPTGRVTLYYAQMDMNSFEEAIDTMKSQQLNVSYYDDETVRGTISVEEAGVMFTSIAYDSAWKVTVDGNRVEPVKIGTALMGVELDEGDHIVEFTYHQQGLVEGAVITVISAGLIVLLTVLDKRKKARRYSHP